MNLNGSPVCNSKHNLFTRLFFMIMGIFMFVAFATNVFCGAEQQKYAFYPYYKYLRWTIFTGFIIVGFFIARYLYVAVRKNSDCILVMLIMAVLIGLCIRLFFYFLFRTQPVSDFNIPNQFYQNFQEIDQYAPFTSWENTDFFQRYYAQYPTWYAYMCIVKFIYNILGYRVFYIIAINWVLFAISSCLIFKIGQLVHTACTGLIAVVFFSFSPSMAVYSNIMTPDHFSALFILLSVYWGIKIEQYLTINFTRQIQDKSMMGISGLIQHLKLHYRLYIYTVLLALTATMVNLFKPLSILFVIAFLCVEFLFRFIPAFRPAGGIKSLFIENAGRIVVFFLAFFLFNSIQGYLLNSSIKNTLKVDTVDSTPMYLLWGYSVDKEGNYNPRVADRIIDEVLSRNNYDLPVAMEEMGQLAKEQLKENAKFIPKILISKFGILFGSEYGFWDFSRYGTDAAYSQSLQTIVESPFLAASMSFATVAYLLSAITSIIVACSKTYSKGLIWCDLIILGYSAVLLLGGVQDRYKALMLALIYITSAVGIVDCFRGWRRLRRKREVNAL